MKRRMVPDLFYLPLALLKQYSQGKNRWHSAALTNVRVTGHHISTSSSKRLKTSSARNPDMNTIQTGGISEEPKGALYEFLWSCLYPPKGLATSPTRSIFSRVFTKVALMCLKNHLRPSHPKKEPELGGKERQPWGSTRQPDLETTQRIEK